MTIYIDPSGRRSFTGAPWDDDPTITDAYLFTPKLTGFLNPGGSIGSSVTAAKGANNITTFSNLTYNDTYNSVKTPAIELTSAGASYFAVDALATSGTARPWFFLISATVPAAPATTWYLWSMTSSTINPPISLIVGSAGSTNFNTVRRNDASTSLSSATISPGTSPFVYAISYNGSTLSSWFNGAIVDNALAFTAGVQTVNQWSVGVSRQPAGGGYSLPKVHGTLWGANAGPSAQQIVAYSTWFRRRARF